MEGTEDFCFDDFRLRPVNVDEWEGQIFVNLDPQAEPLLNALRELPEQAAKFKFGADEVGWPSRLPHAMQLEGVHR